MSTETASQSGLEDAAAILQSIVDQVIDVATVYGLDVLGAIILLVVGVKASGWISRIVAKTLTRTGKVDSTLISFFASAAKYVALAFVGIAVLNQFGVQTASLIALLGAAGLAVGLALQGTLSNVAAGVMLLIFRPFKVGDYVEAAGHSGSIRALNLFFTLMTTPDNVLISVPNSQIWGGSIRNYSVSETRRADFVFGVSYGADLEAAKAAILDVLSSDERTHDDPGPLVAVTELGDSSVNFTARVWVDAGDLWGVKFDMVQAVKERLDRDGIEIPFPTRTVYTKSGD
jgi:small conductance mechanosensitive channel